MGVHGLQSFMERNCPHAFVDVDISRDAVDYRKATGREPVLVVDLASCLSHIYDKVNTDYLCGGQLKEFTFISTKFLSSFQSIGVKCILFSDGSPPIERIQIWMQRRESEYERVKSIIKELNSGNYDKAEEESKRMRPKCLWFSLLAHLKCEGFPVIQTVREADDEILEYIAKHSCFGVLSEDSDFAVAEGVEKSYSIRHLDLNTMRTKAYKRCGLAADLGLLTSDLAVFATLCGNDIVPYERLRDFHICLLQDMPNIRQLNQRAFLPKHHLFPRIVRWMRTVEASNREVLAATFPHLIQLFDASIKSYELPKIEVPVEVVAIGGSWEATLKTATEFMKFKHVDSHIFSVITQLKYFGGVSIQFYDHNEYLCCGILMRPLRQRFYGILLKDRPNNGDPIFVEEYIFLGPKEKLPQNVFPIFPDEHPGLLAVWCNPTSLLETKWRMLCWAVSSRVSVNVVRALPGPLQVPALALYYLIYEVKTFMKRWEVASLVLLAVRMVTASPADCRAIQCKAFSMIAIHIANVYQSTCHMIYTISQACGDPTTLSDFPGYSFFDGKLFHWTYAAMKNGAVGSELLPKGSQDLAAYQAVLRFLYPRGS